MGRRSSCSPTDAAPPASRGTRGAGLLLTILGCIAAGPADAQQSVTGGLAFPAKVSGFSRGAMTDYEPKEPGLGRSYRYERGPVWADVYVYALGLTSIPRDYDQAVSRAQLAHSASAVRAAAERGIYLKAVPKDSFSLPRSGRSSMDCSSFDLTMTTGQAVVSYVCVTNRCGSFRKVRISGPKLTLTGPNRDFVQHWTKSPCLLDVRYAPSRTATG